MELFSFCFRYSTHKISPSYLTIHYITPSRKRTLELDFTRWIMRQDLFEKQPPPPPPLHRQPKTKQIQRTEAPSTFKQRHKRPLLGYKRTQPSNKTPWPLTRRVNGQITSTSRLLEGIKTIVLAPLLRRHFLRRREDMLGARHNKRGAAISNHTVSLSRQATALTRNKNEHEKI